MEPTPETAVSDPYKQGSMGKPAVLLARIRALDNRHPNGSMKRICPRHPNAELVWRTELTGYDKERRHRVCAECGRKVPALSRLMQELDRAARFWAALTGAA